MATESNALTILGILNLADDSFSDGGRFTSLSAAIEHAKRLLSDGADVIDVGAEATNPQARIVDSDEEIRRLTPVVAELKRLTARVSIDTSKPAVMQRMLGLDVDYINDVTGFLSSAAISAVRGSSARLIAMHAVHNVTSDGYPVTAKAEPLSYSPDEIVQRVHAFFQERIETLTAAAISKERLILDPGMGVFLGSDPRASFQVLINLPKLTGLGVPICVCTSRKSFLASVLPAPPRPPTERGAATLASELVAVSQGAKYIRTHDVRALRDGLAIAGALGPARAAPTERLHRI